MKSKFGLKKKVIATLSSDQQQQVNGGEAAGTTSFNICSRGFICCGDRTRGSFTYCTGPQIPMPPSITD